MRCKHSLSLACGLIAAFAAIQVQAQRGVGDPVGVAQQAVQPKVVSLSGTVKAIITEPCKMTTGRSEEGTHILLEPTTGGELNIHLGPTASVGSVADKLVVGQTVAVQAFRTDKLPEDNYVAQSISIGDDVIPLRDENLRPRWAGGRGKQKGRDQSSTAVDVSDLGPGQGNGPAYGQGQGRGRNFANGQGRGGGRGQGQGLGRGRGQGPGFSQEQGFSQEKGCGRGQGLRCEQQLGAMLDALPKSALSEEERKALLLMREEEKLAQDVYVTLDKKWELRPLANISQAESRHMEFVKLLLDRYGLDDPIDEQALGKFPSPTMQDLYDQFVTQGEQSVEEAIKVGAEIEELDIADLRRQIDETDNDDIKVVYQNLLKGSRNHLRAFARQLSRYSVIYSTKHLSQAEFDRIANSDLERCMMISDPNDKF
ncbi:DUF2202 domain-containing protein [Bythopirellula goksoeyrii]|uniref:Uncharacterized protein n=1 Tax=Bythopirellula goksoeyrii TaxID=1400387 RepID=A0A5B9QGN9_9BACT|nr:DUF2202 domain-containing protein [Bythopirellula goksoeyrii]QEG36106.1 hypothetical protein Pr1d_34150 [Bythopirellula goksoeyrii]